IMNCNFTMECPLTSIIHIAKSRASLVAPSSLSAHTERALSLIQDYRYSQFRNVPMLSGREVVTAATIAPVGAYCNIFSTSHDLTTSARKGPWYLTCPTQRFQ